MTTESPPPAPFPIKVDRTDFPRARTLELRRKLGLPDASVDELLNGLEASFVDVAQACVHVHNHAGRYGVDPSKIVLGGFSAGGIAALHAAYALEAPAAALISISGGMDPADCAVHINALNAALPVLLIRAERDLPAIVERTRAVRASLMQHRDARFVAYVVPGQGHFYPAETACVQEDRRGIPAETSTTIQGAILSFLGAARL